MVIFLMNRFLNIEKKKQATYPIQFIDSTINLYAILSFPDANNINSFLLEL